MNQFNDKTDVPVDPIVKSAASAFLGAILGGGFAFLTTKFFGVKDNRYFHEVRDIAIGSSVLSGVAGYFHGEGENKMYVIKIDNIKIKSELDNLMDRTSFVKRLNEDTSKSEQEQHIR